MEVAVLLARLRTLLARRPWIYWAVIAGLALLGASSAWSTMAEVDAARAGWGQRRSVHVAASDLAPGGTIVAEVRELPEAAIPHAAVTEDPTGRTASQRIGAGEVVTAADVGDGLVALVPSGWRAIAVPTDPARPPVAAGDHVAVYAGGDEIAGDGLVVHVAEGTVTVAVPAPQAAAVSVAAREQIAVVALRHP